MSAIKDGLPNLEQAFADFGTAFDLALTSKALEAEQADSTTEFAGSNLTQFGTLMDAELTAHKATNGVAHLSGVTELSYSQIEVNAMLAKRPALAGFPISRFGELSYLPLTVAGSFEGASTNFGGDGQEARNYPGIIEDDGTFVFLRNGSNGSIVGVYYAYVKGVLATTPILTPVRTNRRYSPAYFPSTRTAQYVTRGDLSGACIFGRLQDSTGAKQEWFLSLTNGTFDDTKHTGCLIAAATAFSFPANCYPEVFVGTNAVFIICAQSDQAAAAVEFQVWTIPLASIGNGNTVVPTNITTWNMTGVYGANVAATNMRLAPLAVGAAASQPLIQQDPATTSTVSVLPFYPNQLGLNTYSAQRSDGTVRSRVMSEIVVGNSATGEQVVQNTYFTFIWNPTTKTGSIEAPYNSPGTVTLVSNKITLGGGVIAATRAPWSSGNWFTGETIYYHSSGFWVSIVDQAVVDNPCWVARTKLSNGALDKFTALVGSQPVTSTVNTQYLPAYGSAVGGTIAGSYQLPSGRILVHCTGANAAGNPVRDLVLAQMGADNTNYQSQFNGSYLGFAPNAYRHFLTDLGFVPAQYIGIISEINAAGTITATGAWYMQGLQDTGFVSVDGNLTKTGSTSIAPALYTSISNAMLTALGVTAIQSVVSIVVPQNASIPPFALLSWIDAAKNERVATGELSITAGARNGAITGLSLVTVSPALTIYTFVKDFEPTVALAAEAGGITIFETADSWLVGGLSKHFINRVNFTGFYTFRFAIPKTTNRPDWTTVAYVPVWGQFETQFPTGVPGHGFGMNLQNQSFSDGESKLLFSQFATNLATYKTWAQAAQTASRVLVSQDVAQGWIVYFTTTVPLIFNGAVYTLASTNIDLTTVKTNPASTTFFAYIQIVGGLPKYVISLTELAESGTNMFIGTVVTGANAVSAVNIVKVTRVGTQRISTVSQGSAIPATTGFPSRPADLAWT